MENRGKPEVVVRDVEQHWPVDAVEVGVDGAPPAGGGPKARFVLAEDVDGLVEAGSKRRGRAAGPVRLLGPYDPFLQLRDRDLLVTDAARRKALWPVIGRPGAVVAGGDVVALWRPRSSGKRLRLAVEPWKSLTKAERAGLEEQAERLAAHRGVALAGLDVD